MQILSFFGLDESSTSSLSSSSSFTSLNSTVARDDDLTDRLVTDPDSDEMIIKRDYTQRKMGRKKSGKKSEMLEDIKPASMKDMMRYATKFDWFLLIAGFILSAISGSLSPFGSLIFRGITNTLMKGQADYTEDRLDIDWFTSEMIFYIQMYFYLGIVVFIVSYFATACFFTLSERQIHRIRKSFLRTILNQDQPWFDKNEVGKLTQKMSSGMDRIQEGTSDKIAIIIQAIACQIAGIVVGFSLSWQMSLIMVFIIPFVILTIWGSARSVKRVLKKQMTSYGNAGAVAEEVLNGIRTTIAFNAQQFEANRYAKYLNLGCKSGIRKALFTAFFSGLYLFILFFSMGVAFWFGCNLVMDGTMSPGTVFAVFWSVLIGALRLGQAVPQMSIIMGARLAAGDIFKIIDRKPELDASSETGIKPSTVNGQIEFSNLHFAYPSRAEIKILNGVSLTVEAGQNVAGKSTLIGLLQRFYEQEQGSITLDGNPLEDLNIQWLRSHIGVVSQEPVVFAASIEENLQMGRIDVTPEEMVEACKLANAHEFIQTLPNGYETRIGEGGVRLSGGQKQRLAIARALVRNPRILLLDEATSALDTESERAVQEALDNASANRTTITIAHRLSTIRNADRIFVFDHGLIVESGTHEELMEQQTGVYRQLVLAQEIDRTGQDDVIIGDDDEEDLINSPKSPNGMKRHWGSNGNKITDSLVESDTISDTKAERISRASRRIRESMASTHSFSVTPVSPDVGDKLEEMEEENAEQASLLDIWRFSRSEHCLILTGLLFTLARGFSTPIFSVVYGRLFKALSEAFSSNLSKEEFQRSNLENAITFASLGLFAGITTFFSGFLFGTSGEKMTQRLRTEAFGNLLRQDGAFYDDLRHSTGKLTARLAQDAPNVQAAVDQRLAEVLQGLVALCAGISIAFYFDWSMAPCGVATAVLIVIVQLLLTGYLKRRAVVDIQIAEESSRIASESISYVKTVQSLTLQSHLYDRFCSASILSHRRAITRGLLASLNYAIMSTFVNFNFGCAYLFGLLLVRNGWATPFAVFQVIEALNMASISIMTAATYFPEYLRARVSAGLMFKMMNEEPSIDSMAKGGKQPKIVGNVTLNNVYFAYPTTLKRMIMNDFSVEAKSGETLALVGPSGCGKSTTIQLVERFYDVLAGSVNIDGVDIREINLHHLRNHIALVQQEPTLFDLSIAENIAYGLENVTDAQIVEAAKLANIHDFVDSLPKKYNTSCGSRGTQLSGGQKQRIAIARALIRDPRVLLLDEATSALDTESEKIVQEALDKARLGRTCITIAHRLSTIQHANKIAVVRAGRVIEQGTHQQLLTGRGLYYKLVQKQ
ncbi:Multidrug resistance protein pgp-3 [Aphelenchoides besseyi]|nr:Multidrug resistance protein pgp-3 [Aphelenchoides besseyi]